MKRGIIFFTAFFVLSAALASSQILPSCNLEAKLVSQDPYPAIQGDYVKLIFQLSGNGVTNPSCGKIYFELAENFPISFDPGASRVSVIQSGSYSQGFQSFVLFPYKVRVDPDALDGENTLEVFYSSNYGSNTLLKKEEFNFTVEDVRTDFEVSIKDYEKSTNTMTFEILNIGKADVDALTAEIPKQENIEVKGSNRNIIGSLDSSEDTTFDFEAIPKKGEILVNLLYTDKTGARRSLEKKILFEPSYFEGRSRDNSGISLTWIIIIIAVVIAGVVLARNRIRRRKLHHLKHHSLKHHSHHDKP